MVELTKGVLHEFYGELAVDDKNYSYLFMNQRLCDLNTLKFWMNYFVLCKTCYIKALSRGILSLFENRCYGYGLPTIVYYVKKSRPSFNKLTYFMVWHSLNSTKENRNHS